MCEKHNLTTKIDPIIEILFKIKKNSKNKIKILYLSPQGKNINQNNVKTLAVAEKELILLCIRNNGVDERIINLKNILKVSIGDYIVNSGDIASLIITNSITRLNSNLLNKDKIKNDTFHKNGFNNNNYISPNKTYKKNIPKILKTLNTKKIHKWKEKISNVTTSFYRPDLIKKKV